MRAVDKGPPPVQADGQPVEMASYQDAADHLKRRLGRYCSFCERPVPVGLAVEHKWPRLHFPELERAWENLLLGCMNCNSHKGTRHVAVGGVMFPDTHDTFAAFEYIESGRIRPRPTLADAAPAAALLDLVGLSREPQQLSTADHRWDDRLETWALACQSRDDLAANDSPLVRAAILRTAVARGGFSIWMAVFAHDPAMRRALAQAFPGTRPLQCAA
ncbi:HNH endonuclease [Roseateles amylovorans]|uniref:HNH endonuclease n=1 Tax=Roseateles amylovorans TaxID=2978473 RepID=A0ABY6B0Q7_9BURK|nr:HNH endonuclease [Roseateles amylovorans]UXH78758.1 HNH endonuclease [Roseateles amylovorans]